LESAWGSDEGIRFIHSEQFQLHVEIEQRHWWFVGRRRILRRLIAGSVPSDLGELAGQARLFLLTDVLEHVGDDFAMLSELLAAASPGCCFLLTVPADESLWSEHDESFGHYRRYDRARLEQVWAGLPAKTLLISYFNTRLLPLVRLVRAWNHRRGHAAGRAGTVFWAARPAGQRAADGHFRRRGRPAGPICARPPPLRLSGRDQPNRPAPPRRRRYPHPL
jgi:hypothetical protein